MSTIPLEPEKYYHIYNHANGSDNIFNDEADILNFIKYYKKFIVPVADTFAYCFLSNHFHILVRIKSLNELFKHPAYKKFRESSRQERNSSFFEEINKKTSYQFAHAFNSYTQSFNKKYERIGSLFKRSFKRKWINEEKYFIKTVLYIHQNPIEHGFVEHLSQWKYSSYHIILNESKTFIKRNEVIEAFGDKENFIYVNNKPLSQSF